MKPIRTHVIGVIGGSGTGKTYFAKHVQSYLKAAFIEGDVIGHEALSQKPIIDSIVEAFGSSVIKEGQIDRQTLGAMVFSDKDKLLQLNKLMHPHMYRMIEEKIKSTENKTLVLEAAVMIEAGFYELVDTMIFIRADRDVRLQRLIEFRGISAQRAEQMIENGRKDYHLYSDYIIDTSFGLDFIEEEVDKLLNKIQEAANEKNDPSS